MCHTSREAVHGLTVSNTSLHMVGYRTAHPSRKETFVDSSLVFFHLGSFLLGMTSAVALLFRLAGRNGADGSESCLGVAICISGVGLAALCYVVGVKL